MLVKYRKNNRWDIRILDIPKTELLDSNKIINELQKLVLIKNNEFIDIVDMDIDILDDKYMVKVYFAIEKEQQA